MRLHLWVAALGLPLLMAAPAAARQPSASGPPRAASLIGPLVSETSVPPIRGGKGLKIVRDTFVSEDGSSQVRRGIVRQMELAQDVTLGFGVYKVSRYSKREPDFKRLQPMQDVDGRKQSIAALGLNVRF